MSVPEERRVRRWLALFFALTGAGLGFGLWAMYPHLVEEHRRLEPWQAVLIWTGDVAALFWFVRYLVAHYCRGRPLAEEVSGKGRAVATVTLLLALAVDLGVTVLLERHDAARFQAAEVVAGEVHAVELRNSDSAMYRLRCHFRSKNGVPREAAFYAGGIRNGKNPDLPGDLVQNLVRGQIPFPLEVSYDPQNPARTWITDLGGARHGLRLLSLSLGAVFFQGVGLFILYGLAATYQQRYGRNPWWVGLHRAYPIMAEAVVLSLMGIVCLIAL